MAARTRPVGTGAWILWGLTFLGILILIALIGGLWGWTSSNVVGNYNLNACNDYDPCTGGYALNDGSCTFRQLQNGTDCTRENYCFAPGTSTTCCDGTCTNPNVTLCKGFCEVDADCIYSVPFEQNIIDTNNTLGVVIIGPFCIASSCVTYLTGGKASCESWLDNSCSSTTTNKYTSNCIEVDSFAIIPNHTLQVQPGGTITSNVTATEYNQCMYKWKCAPFEYLLFKKRTTDDTIDISGNGFESKIGSHQIKHDTFFKNQPLSKQQYNHLIQQEHNALNHGEIKKEGKEGKEHSHIRKIPKKQVIN